MKNLIHLLFTCLPLLAASQDNWASYSISFNPTGHAGKPFRLEASVRSEIVDDSASARIWARVDNEKGKTNFFGNMWFEPIRNSAWKKYTIEGNIGEGATQLAFGALCQYNGTFFFDDFKLAIETKPGQWTTVFEDGFEAAGTGDWKRGVRRWEETNYGINELFQIERSGAKPASGKHCLKITGSAVPNYGINDKAGRYLDVNGIKLYCEIYGEGQPLVILHTSNSSIQDAGPFIPEFAKKYKVIAFDNRGHGRSGDTEADFTYDVMADDIAKALDQLGVDSAYVGGYSDGAVQGLLLAMKHPRLVKKLLAIVPQVRCDTTANYAVILQTLQKELASTSSNALGRKTAKLMLTQPNIPFKDLVAIQCPVLVLAGDRDWVKLEHVLKVFQSIPQSQLCILPGADHSSIFSHRELFLQLATAFFDKPFAMPSTVDWFKE